MDQDAESFNVSLTLFYRAARNYGNGMFTFLMSTGVCWSPVHIIKMPLKPKPQPRNACNKPNVSSTRNTVTTKTPKKILISKNWHKNCSHEVKTVSDRIIKSKEHGDKPNKASVSLSSIPKQGKVLDFSKTCGDTAKTKTNFTRIYNITTNATNNTNNSSKICKSSTKENKHANNNVDTKTQIVEEYYKNEKFGKSNSTVDHTKTQMTFTRIKSKTKNSKATLKDVAKERATEHVVQEHYMNENFANLYDSTYEIDTIMKNGQTLDTINEVNEKQASLGTGSKAATSNDKSSRGSNVCILEDSDDDLSLKRLKEFREKNYFECHSSRPRVKNKASAISIKEHKCRYRLYLNDRLFPVAIDDDHNGNIRCVDCHLPFKTSGNEKQPNGTIQAKVKLGSETQDMVLLLPIKEPLIIKQKKKEKIDNDEIYFGVVKLDQYGHSRFNPNLPTDSLALRYQKGYRQFYNDQSYKYEKVKESDVIVI